jgi:hypothetical protein
MNIEEFNQIYQIIKEHKTEIFINVDKSLLIEAYKSDPETLKKVLNNVKGYKSISEIKKICNINCNNNIISFIINNMNFD